MSGRTWVLGMAALAFVTGLALGRSPDGATAQEGGRIFLPVAMHAVAVESLPAPDPILPTQTSRPSDTPRPTETPVTPPPTFTRLPTRTPEPTEPPIRSSIFGDIVAEGKPLPEGFGEPGGPQIELRRCTSDTGEPCPLANWQRIAATTTDAQGGFVFHSPQPLGEGELYQVWWVNDDTDDVQGDSRFVNRWWSRVIDAFGPGDDVDVGTFDVTDLKYVSICHDCGQTLPITFKWRARARRSETYRWSLFRGCGDIANREGAWRTAPLGHASDYTLASPPPGFRLDEKYCWYVFINGGEDGTGWPFFDWRVTFLPPP